MRKVRFTQKQIEECLKRSIEEGIGAVNLNTQNFDNLSVKQATDVAKNIATSNGSVDVTLNGNKVDGTSDTSSVANNIVDAAKEAANGSLSEGMSKKQIKEAKLKYLKENSYSVRKRDLK